MARQGNSRNLSVSLTYIRQENLDLHSHPVIILAIPAIRVPNSVLVLLCEAEEDHASRARLRRCRCLLRGRLARMQQVSPDDEESRLRGAEGDAAGWERESAGKDGGDGCHLRALIFERYRLIFVWADNSQQSKCVHRSEKEGAGVFQRSKRSLDPD